MPTAEDLQLGYLKYNEKPDYLVEPTSEASYTYDAVGNRLTQTTDEGTVNYSYDEANRLLSDGTSSYSYNAAGNLVSVQSGDQTVSYSYTASDRLSQVKYPDDTYVSYTYDAFGRKTIREEAYWKLNENGKSQYAPGQQKESKSNGNGGNSSKNSSGTNTKNGKKQNPLKLETDTTWYMYEGFSSNIFKEYTGDGAPLGQYYTANDFILGRKMFGNHGLTGRDTGLKTNGGMMYYTYDGMRNVTALTDHNDGSVIEQYRYDAFGSLYTGVTAPYNTAGFAGRQYDPKASLVDMSARWYAPQTGRFITPDPYGGDLLTPYTQNRYAYVGNNPINRWDPTGYWESGDENRSQAAQAEIQRLTDLWEGTDDPDLQAQYHAAAEEVRRLDSSRSYNESEVFSHTTTDEDMDYGSRNKGSDGWYTSWTKTIYTSDIYNVYSNEINDYSGEIVSTTLTGTRPHTSQTITTGVNFDPFTAGEWYEEHKDDLARYGTPPPTFTPGTAYSKETGSTTIKTGSTFNAIASSSPTGAALKVKGISAPSKSKVKSTGVPVKGVVNTKTAKKLDQAAKQQKPAPKKKTPSTPSPKETSKTTTTKGISIPGGHDPDDPRFSRNKGTSNVGFGDFRTFNQGKSNGKASPKLFYNNQLGIYDTYDYSKDYTYWDAVGDRFFINSGLPFVTKMIADSGKTPFGRTITQEEKEVLYERDKENLIQTIMFLAFSGKAKEAPVGFKAPAGSLGAMKALPGTKSIGKSPGLTIDKNTGWEIGRFIADEKGNVMIEPVGGSTVPAGKGGIDTHTTYPNGSNYQRYNPFGHPPKSVLPHGHGHLEGTGPGMKGQGPSIDINGKIVPWNSPDAHWPLFFK